MKTSKEFFERLQSDEAFAQEIGAKVKEKFDAGETDYKALWIPIAEEYDYELNEAELDEMYEKAVSEMSDEELGKVAGGATPFAIGIVPLTIMLGASATVVASASASISYITAKLHEDD